jgi:hypothetical protein
MYFGCLDGDWNADHDAVFGEFGSDNADLWANVYVGRLPTRSNAEVNVIVNKIKNYERPAHTASPRRCCSWRSALPVRLDERPPLARRRAARGVRPQFRHDPAGLVVNRNYQNYTAWAGSNNETRQAGHRIR